MFGGRRVEDAVGANRHRRDVPLPQRRLHRLGIPMGEDENRNVARADATSRPPVVRGREPGCVQEIPDLLGKVVGDRLHGILGDYSAPVGAGQVVSESQA